MLSTDRMVCPLHVDLLVGAGVPAGDLPRRRDAVYRRVTRLLAVCLLPVAHVVAGGTGRMSILSWGGQPAGDHNDGRPPADRESGHAAGGFALAARTVAARTVAARTVAARTVAARWALSVRFPAESLAGLTPATRAAFEAARARALWRDGEAIGLTSGYRDAGRQEWLFAEATQRYGSSEAARLRALPPGESRHCAGTALDVRPTEGARWLERFGAPYGLYRVYDNEWWHFEYHPAGPPNRLPHPGCPTPQVCRGHLRRAADERSAARAGERSGQRSGQRPGGRIGWVTTP
jgi:hypothetical protein